MGGNLGGGVKCIPFLFKQNNFIYLLSSQSKTYEHNSNCFVHPMNTSDIVCLVPYASLLGAESEASLPFLRLADNWKDR